MPKHVPSGNTQTTTYSKLSNRPLLLLELLMMTMLTTMLTTTMMMVVVLVMLRSESLFKTIL